jgi:hypothetical protein
MALSPEFRRVMQRLGGEWEYQITGSRAWILSFFSQGPPPIAVVYLHKKRERLFFEELVKLSDIRRVWDARAVLVATPRAIKPDEIQLATNSGIYAVLDGDVANLQVALGGGEISEVNRATQVRLLGKKSRSASQECRSLMLDLLSKKWMTIRELEEQLQWRFDGRTVRAQVRRLQRMGKLCVRGRTNHGEGLIGTPSGRYQARPDLSVPTMGFFLSQEIAQLIERGAKPMNYREISEKLGIKAHVTTAVLRGLAGDGVVEKSGAGWKIKILKK